MIRANPPMRSALLAQDGEVELKQNFGAGESRRDDAGRDRPGRSEKLADDRIDGGAIGAIADVNGDFADVIARGARFRQQDRKVLHRKLGLRGGIGGTPATRRDTRMIERRASLTAYEKLIC